MSAALSGIARLALADLPHPWSVAPRGTNGVVVVSAPAAREKRGRTYFRPVPLALIRTGDAYADRAIADLLIQAGEIAAAAQAILDGGAEDSFGTFTYTPPARAGADALSRLRRALRMDSPPPPPFRCGICRVKRA